MWLYEPSAGDRGWGRGGGRVGAGWGRGGGGDGLGRKSQPHSGAIGNNRVWMLTFITITLLFFRPENIKLNANLGIKSA